jgi:hypothetical protein
MLQLASSPTANKVRGEREREEGSEFCLGGTTRGTCRDKQAGSGGSSMRCNQKTVDESTNGIGKGLRIHT